MTKEEINAIYGNPQIVRTLADLINAKTEYIIIKPYPTDPDGFEYERRLDDVDY